MKDKTRTNNSKFSGTNIFYLMYFEKSISARIKNQKDQKSWIFGKILLQWPCFSWKISFIFFSKNFQLFFRFIYLFFGRAKICKAYFCRNKRTEIVYFCKRIDTKSCIFFNVFLSKFYICSLKKIKIQSSLIQNAIIVIF